MERVAPFASITLAIGGYGYQISTRDAGDVELLGMFCRAGESSRGEDHLDGAGGGDGRGNLRVAKTPPLQSALRGECCGVWLCPTFMQLRASTGTA